MAETQAPASNAIEPPALPPGTEERVLAELAAKAPDIEITTAGDPGFQETRRANGDLVNKIAVSSGGVPFRGLPDMEPPAEEPAAAPTAEELAEARNRAVMAAGPRITEPTNKPEAEKAPEIDWSDEPDWTDGALYKTEEEAIAARQKYMADKAAEHAKELAEFNARQAQRTETARQAEYEQHAMAARQLETARQLQKSLGFDDAKFQSAAQDYATVRHPSPADPRVLNPVAQYLATARDSHLVQRARHGLPVADQESVAEILSAQFSDMDFARKMAAVVPDDVTGGIVMTAVAQLPAPVRVLKHLVTDDGQKYVNDVVRRYGDSRHLNVSQRSAVLNEVMMDLIRTDAGLETAPKSAPKQKQGTPAAQAAAPAGQAAAPATAAGPGRFTEREPAAPRSTPAPAHTAPPPGGGPEAFSDAWIAAEVKAARSGKYESLFNQGGY